jgi:hypothetical protein
MRQSLGCVVRALAVLVLLGCAQTLYAGSITASGTLTTTLLSPDTYQVTALSLMRNGVSTMTLLGVNGYGDNNNLVYSPPSPSFVDVFGVAYSIGSTDYNFYYYLGKYWECNSVNSPSCGDGSGVPLSTFTLTPVVGVPDTFSFSYTYSPSITTPEPSSLLLFGTSLLGLAPFRKRLFGR